MAASQHGPLQVKGRERIQQGTIEKFKNNTIAFVTGAATFGGSAWEVSQNLHRKDVTILERAQDEPTRAPATARS